ncbi:unnamed protein product [Effrenium voratum]|uniref:RRM domain-containing protein n=1 Tax=Effrenium voratum TaxID=2562239 RepID=A0AA36IWS8_9DINO|nr:unnamed protein product [Effrenium voratum]
MVRCPIPVQTACSGVELHSKNLGEKIVPAITVSLSIDIPVEELIEALTSFQQGHPPQPNELPSTFMEKPRKALSSQEKPRKEMHMQVGPPPGLTAQWETLAPNMRIFNRVKVSNLVKRLKSQDVQSIFERHVGPVAHCSLVEDSASITFLNSEHASTAVEKYDGGVLEVSTDKSLSGSDAILLFPKDGSFRRTVEDRLGPLTQCHLRRGEGWMTLFRGAITKQLKREEALNQIDFKGTVITVALDTSGSGEERRPKPVMAKRHLAGMRPGSSAGVKFDEDDSPGGLGQLAPVRPNTSQSPRTKSATSNAWHDVMEMCRKAFTSKMHSVGNEILQDVRGEVQRAVGTLREEIGTMLEAREHTANQQLESLLDQIKHLRQTTEESVMNIQLDLSPVLQEIQRLDGQHSEARQRHEQQLEKMLQHLSQASARAEMDEEKLQRLQERQDHTEGLLCSVQTGQEMLAVSLERAAEEVQKSRAKSHEDHADMMLFSSHASQRIHERLQEPVHVDFGEVLRELRKNQLATTSDTRTMLGEIGKIQQALHLDFIQMAEYVREESQKRPSVVAVEAVEVDPPELEVEPISKELHVSGAKSLGVVDFLDKEPPKLDRIASTPAPPEKDGTRSVPNEVVSYKRGPMP